MEVSLTLAGRKVRLRSTTAADGPRLLEIRSTSEVWSRWRGDDLAVELRRDLEDDEVHQMTVVAPDGIVVGLVQFAEEDEPDYRYASIDIYIDPAFQRRGYGSDAITTLAHHLFDQRGHHRLTIDPVADNQPAIRCYAKVGFRPVGVMRGYERQADGSWADGLLMELLASDRVGSDRSLGSDRAPGTDSSLGTGGLDEAGMATNRDNWNARVPVHIGEDGYPLDQLAADPTALSDVIDFDRRYLGDLAGRELIHLQCHIGTDTVSLARLGASVTGLDFSPAALEVGRDFAARCGLEARFVEGNVYDAVAIVGRTYDIVYTGVGAINWLPDIGRWAEVVAALLRPGGRFHITEGHPMAMIFSDQATPDAMAIEYPYFDGTPAMRFDEPESYSGTGRVASPQGVEWAHDLGSVVQALIDAGLVIDRLDEHRELPWRFLPWMEPAPDRPGWFRLPEPLRASVPLSFTIQAHRPI
ncbi:MAG: GNAT family N-acetyltransferase [Acidimicrobiales bacterium]